MLTLAEAVSNHYHFLTELAAKLLWVRGRGWPTSAGGAPVPLLLAPGAGGREAVLDLLALLGRSAEELPEQAESYHCRFEALHVPVWSRVAPAERPTDEVYHAPAGQLLLARRELLDAARKALGPDAFDRQERVLVVTRQDARTRRALELFDAVASVAPATLFQPGRLLEQAATFARHRVVVAPTGAALANMVFMPQDGAVVLLPGAPWSEHWHHLAAVLQSARLLAGGLHVVAMASSPFAGDYALTAESCADLLGALRALLPPGSQGSGRPPPACAGAQPEGAPVCRAAAGLGPTACFDWASFEAEPNVTYWHSATEQYYARASVACSRSRSRRGDTLATLLSAARVACAQASVRRTTEVELEADGT